MIIDKTSLYLSLRNNSESSSNFEEVSLNGDSNSTPVNESPKRWVFCEILVKILMMFGFHNCCSRAWLKIYDS